MTMDTMTNPWGEDKHLSATSGFDADKNLAFEDSFLNSKFSSICQTEGKTYVPLDDSEQYLAGLEKKLAGIQGKNLSKRDNERKNLINALVKSREDHNARFLSSEDENIPKNEFDESENESFRKPSVNAVNPQGTLGLVMRKCAPEHVALSAEELCELLKSDILAKAHEELQSDHETEEDSKSECGQVTQEKECGAVTQEKECAAVTQDSL